LGIHYNPVPLLWLVKIRTSKGAKASTAFVERKRLDAHPALSPNVNDCNRITPGFRARG